MLYSLNRFNNYTKLFIQDKQIFYNKDQSMHSFFRILALVSIMSILAGCVKYPFINDFVAPYQIGVSYYQNGAYQVESIIHPDSWKNEF
jgi:hypothetical protein